MNPPSLTSSGPSIPSPPHLPTRPRPSATRTGAVIVLFALVIAGSWSISSLGINFPTIFKSIDNAAQFIGRMFPLDFPSFGETVSMVVESLAIVFLATVLSVIISIPLALAAARSTSRSRISQGTARTLIVIARAVPDIILAIIFLRLFGLGATAGILAMGVHSIGMIAKLYADAIDELDDGPREAVQSSGGSRSQQVTSATLQELMPQIIATALHRFDINLRTSVLLGYVGVGGIGLAIADALRVLDYQRGMALALIVLVLCIAVEFISGGIRSALMAKSPNHSGRRSWTDRLWTMIRTKDSVHRTREMDLASARTTPPWTIDRVRRAMTFVLIAVLVLASIARVDISLSGLWNGLLDIPATLALFFPPSSGGDMALLLELLLITIQIALAATLIGAVLAIPLGVLAASNVVSHRPTRNAFRIVIVVVRAIPELILAVVFVVISGLGAVAGTLALSMGAMGLLAKLIADSLEETDQDVQSAVRSTGAGEVQVFFSATLRQAAPAFVAHTMYLLDTNIRSATLLGVVGAGGIGFQLLNASRVNQFDVVTMILLLIVAVVLVVEGLSMWLRKAVR